MAGQTPERKFAQVRFNGVLDEARSPRDVGATGLTACNNSTYRRFGSWGRRPGSQPAYTSTIAGPLGATNASAIRWYRAFPSPLTQLVVAAQGALWTGGDPSLPSVQPLTQIANQPVFTGQQTDPVGFAAAYDPAVNNGNGSDILIICGFTGPFAFATGVIVLSGNPTTGQTINVRVKKGGNDVTTATYTLLPTDTKLSAIAGIVAGLINNSAIVTPGTPMLAASVVLNTPNVVQIATYALLSGTDGNSIQVKVTIVGAGMTATPNALTNLTGGGGPSSAPLKYDGSMVSGLSPYITQPFTACWSWHEHVFLWGDPGNPDTLFATDINQPEGWSFMIANGGGGTSGGYNIGQGDGDAFIRAVMPIGNILYILKAASIYAMTGYNFQGGEYQFSVEPAIKGTGTPSKECVTRLGNALVFWDGSKFCRLQVGSFEVEAIGSPIPITSGKVAIQNQRLIRSCAGDFLVRTSLRDVVSPPAAPFGFEMMERVAMFACDVSGSGVADTILVYDDQASRRLGDYAWSIWTGWQVSAFVQFGGGASSTSLAEIPRLFWIPPVGAALFTLNLFGGDAWFDSLQPIPWNVQTGWWEGDDADLIKELHRVFVKMEANTGIQPSLEAVSFKGFGTNPGYAEFPPTPFTLASTASGIETYSVAIVPINPRLVGNAYSFELSEPGVAAANFEAVGLTLDYQVEAYRP